MVKPLFNMELNKQRKFTNCMLIKRQFCKLSEIVNLFHRTYQMYIVNQIHAFSFP